MRGSTIPGLLQKVGTGWRLTDHSATQAPKLATVAVNTVAKRGRRVAEEMSRNHWLEVTQSSALAWLPPSLQVPLAGQPHGGGLDIFQRL